ncbi:MULTISPECIES: hypothetical protein [Agrobacterium]|uniref:hypothetical protein n=1 Tax=Agrobacterium TaxID=357 RepID=UPI002300087E|nr:MULTISPECIES: hypothetical protein [Agrobacterium]MDA5627070.1 hypothetical protein [Agrobacterium sp. ST15.16.055]MDA6980129.1 hypothetical protein [Agrobacterium salinitolerans]
MMGKWHNINWLLVAGLATLAYALIVLHWIGLDRISIYPTNNSLNEVGDFIAGFFAPLAVIWLICAVFTQRQELVDTRDQFKKNQEAINGQMAEIKEQSAFLLKQHTLAEETAKKTYRLSLFERRFKLYEEFISFGDTWVKRDFLDPAHLEMVELTQKARFLFPSDVVEWFGEIELMLIEVVQLHQGFSKIEVTDDAVAFERWTDEEMKMKFLLLRQKLMEQFFNPEIRNEKFATAMAVSD